MIGLQSSHNAQWRKTNDPISWLRNRHHSHYSNYSLLAICDHSLFAARVFQTLTSEARKQNWNSTEIYNFLLIGLNLRSPFDFPYHVWRSRALSNLNFSPKSSSMKEKNIFTIKGASGLGQSAFWETHPCLRNVLFNNLFFFFKCLETLFRNSFEV